MDIAQKYKIVEKIIHQLLGSEPKPVDLRPFVNDHY